MRGFSPFILNGDIFMKRYLLIVAGAALPFSLSVLYMNSRVYAVILGGILCVPIVFYRSFFYKKNRLSLLCLLMVALFTLRCLHFAEKVHYCESLDGRRVYLQAVICEITLSSQNRENQRLEARLVNDNLGALSKGDRLHIICEDAHLYEIGQQISGQAVLKAVKESSKAYYFGENVIMTAVFDKGARCETSNDPILRSVAGVRRGIHETLAKQSDHPSFLSALLYGDRNGLSLPLVVAMRQVGVSHALAISGLHFSVLYGGFLLLLRLLFLPTWIRDLLSLAFAAFLILLCGLTPSVLRAGLVLVLYLIYRRLSRVKEPVLCLSGALLVLLFINPAAVYSVSLQLSFSSAFGILLLSERLEKRLLQAIPYRLPRRLLSGVSVSLAATLGIFPFIVYHFQEVSLVGVLMNLLIVPLIGIVVMLSAVGVITAYLPVDFVSRALFFVVDRLCEVFFTVTQAVARCPFSSLQLQHSTLFCAAILVVYALVWEANTCKCRQLLLQWKKKYKGDHGLCNR